MGLVFIVQMVASDRRLCLCRTLSPGSGEIPQTKTSQTAFVLRYSWSVILCDHSSMCDPLLLFTLNYIQNTFVKCVHKTVVPDVICTGRNNFCWLPANILPIGKLVISAAATAWLSCWIRVLTQQLPVDRAPYFRCYLPRGVVKMINDAYQLSWAQEEPFGGISLGWLKFLYGEVL